LALLVTVSAVRAAEPPAAAEPSAAGKPKLAIENETVDAGQVIRGSEAKFVFVVKNAGDALLKITSAKPG